MYLSYYKLKAKPFQMSTDPNFLWLGEKHKEALATLEYAVFENKGVLALTGDVGTGKTTLINALVESLGKDILAATIYDPSLKIVEFFNIVADAFNMGRTFSGKGEFLIHFRQFLKKARERNQKVLLIIDEAQRIDAELLEELRLLSNLEAEHIRLLNIFFVGQNEFIDILQEDRNRALRQRIAIRYHIEPLTLNEAEAYTRHRLKIAGARARVFSSGAIQEIFAFSNGYPRLINIICDHALLSGYVRELIIINADIIRECREELQISTWVPDKEADSIRKHKEELRMLKRIPVQDVDYPDDDKSRPESEPGAVQAPGDPEPGRKRIRRAVLGIALLAMLGGGAGYHYYNAGKTKTESPGTTTHKISEASDSEQADSKNDTQAILPPAPESPEVSAKVNAEEAGVDRVSLIESSKPGSFEEITPKEVEIAAFVPPDRTTSALPSATLASKKQTSDFQKPAPKSIQPSAKPKTSEAIKRDAGKGVESKTQQPGAKPVQAPKETYGTERVKSYYQIDKTLTPAKKPTAVQDSPIVSSTPSKKQVTRPATKSPGNVPGPMTSPEEAKQASQKLVTDSSAPTKEAAPEKKNIISSADQKAAFKTQRGGEPEASSGDTFRYEDLQYRLNAFLTNYCQAYENKQLDGFSTFFTPDAVEKGKPFSSFLQQYRRNFERIDSMNYRIELKRYAIQEETGLVRIEGIFHVRARLNDSGKWLENSGEIYMVLIEDGDSFKVRRLDY